MPKNRENQIVSTSWMKMAWKFVLPAVTVLSVTVTAASSFAESAFSDTRGGSTVFHQTGAYGGSGGGN